jgi:hypothetical protein
MEISVPASRKKSVTELAAERQRLCDNFNNREVDDEKVDVPEFNKLLAVERKLAQADFSKAADKRIGNSILMEDKPSRWDNFQESLFLRIQQFA